jgi:hypothetical protein
MEIIGKIATDLESRRGGLALAPSFYMRKALRLGPMFLMTWAACGGDSTRPATQQEIQTATGFLSSASNVRSSFNGMTLIGSGTSGSGCSTLSMGQLTFNCPDLTGIITMSGDTYTFDVHATGAIDLHEVGELTVRDDFIDGSLSMDMSSAQISLSSKMTFAGVTLTNGCPTAGHIDASVDATTQGQHQAQSISIDFGPTCGAATIHE